MMLLSLALVAMVAADLANYLEKHHVKMATTSLGGIALQENNMDMGFGGINSMRSNSSYAMDGSRSAEGECKGAQCEAEIEFGVQGLMACENGKGDLCGGVRVSSIEGDLRGGVQVSSMDGGVQVPTTTAWMSKLRVQVLGNRNSYNASEEEHEADVSSSLACEKSFAGATCIQHRSLPVTIQPPGNG